MTMGRMPRRGRGGLWARLAAQRAAAVVFALLVCVSAGTAAALPRAYGGYTGDALRQAVSGAPLKDRLVTGVGGPYRPTSSENGTGRDLTGPRAVERARTALGDLLPAPVRTGGDDVVRGVSSAEPGAVPDPGLPRPTADRDPTASLHAQNDLAAHARLVDGRLPGPRARLGAGEAEVEAVLTEATSRRMRLEVGDDFHLPSVFFGEGAGFTVRVVGVVAPKDPGSPWWRAERQLLKPALVAQRPPGGELQSAWHFTAHVHPEAAPALTYLRDGARLFWHFPLDEAALGVEQIPALERTLDSLADGPLADRLDARARLGPLTVQGGLAALLEIFSAERATVTPLLLTAALGLGTTVLSVLLLWGLLAAERRREELALLRARGGSRRQLGGRLLAENTLLGLPAAALGAGAALALTDGPLPSALLAAAAVTAAGLAAPSAAALAVACRAGQGRADLLRARPTRRRTVAEVTLLAVALAGVLTLRGRGADPAGGDPDPLLAAVPVLLALAAALVLLRLYPLPLRLLTRPAARRRGPVAFVGLARAGRGPATAVLPLVALLVALTVASFGGTVLSVVETGRDRAALAAVGADARLDAFEALPGELVERATTADGVTGTVGAHLYPEGTVLPDDAGGGGLATVAVVDPARYARLSAERDLGAYPAAALEGEAGGPLPALISPALAEQVGEGTLNVSVQGFTMTVRPALTRAQTLVTDAEDFLVVSRTALERAQPDLAGTALTAPNTLLLEGTRLDERALRAVAADGDSTTAAQFLSDERDRYTSSLVQTGAQRLYTAAVFASAGYALLAVLLTLVQNAPQRAALLARLRSLGMPRRTGRRLLLAEALPLYVLTAAAGALTALAAVPLLRPGIDLTALAGTRGGTPLRLAVDPLWLTAPAACLVAAATVALLVQASLAARHRTAPTEEAP